MLCPQGSWRLSRLALTSLGPFCCFLSTRLGKKTAKSRKDPAAGLRFYKNVGLGFKTPREAIEGGLGRVLMSGR